MVCDLHTTIRIVIRRAMCLSKDHVRYERFACVDATRDRMETLGVGRNGLSCSFRHGMCFLTFLAHATRN